MTTSDSILFFFPKPNEVSVLLDIYDNKQFQNLSIARERVNDVTPAFDFFSYEYFQSKTNERQKTSEKSFA